MYMYLKKDVRNMDDKYTLKNYKLIALTVQ